jgi:6-pyruvoyl-tetrahydropterin synthase
MQFEDLHTLSHKATLKINEQIKANRTTASIYNFLREQYKKHCPPKESFFKKLNKTITECRVNDNITSLKEQIHTAIETLKVQEHSLENYEEIEDLLELLNREGSSTEENKIILKEISHLLNVNSLQQ